MSMDPSRLPLPLDIFKNGGPMILKNVRLNREYKDGKPTDKVNGLKVDVVLEKNGYETLTVKVADPIDRLTAAMEKSDKPIHVDFTGFQARVYVMNGRGGITAKAETVYIVDDEAISDINFDDDDFDVPELRT